MKTMIPTETVTLHKKTLLGSDDFGHETYTITDISISDVIVGQPASSDIESDIQVYGKRCAYRLGIPNTDDNDWEDALVTIRGKVFHTIGLPVAYTTGWMPKWWRWNKQIEVEEYE